MAPRHERLQGDLTALATMSPARLREEWSRITRRPLPRLSAKLLRLALAFEIQCRIHGGGSPRSHKQFAQLAAAMPAGRQICAGMKLVREWNGVLHVVTLGEDKENRWNERSWGSLSEVARAITGTRWSGPLFFGLKQRTAA